MRQGQTETIGLSVILSDLFMSRQKRGITDAAGQVTMIYCYSGPMGQNIWQIARSCQSVPLIS